MTALLGAILVLWQWPFLPATGPVWLLYWAHDELALPLWGAYWDRNLPYSAIAAVITCVVIGGLAILRARLALLYERGLVLLVTTRPGRAILGAWSRGLRRLGFGGVVRWALVVADRECELRLVRLSKPDLAGEEAELAMDVLANAVSLRTCLVGGRSLRAAYDAARLLLELRLLLKPDLQDRLDLRLGSALERLAGSEDELVRDGVLLFRLLSGVGPQPQVHDDGKREVLAGFFDRVAALSRDPGSLERMPDRGRLARTVSFAIARLFDDRELALAWLDAEEAGQFAADGMILGGVSRDRPRPLIDTALLQLIGASPGLWQVNAGPAGDLDASWWRPWPASG
jgi:hypothetical protein